MVSIVRPASEPKPPSNHTVPDSLQSEPERLAYRQGYAVAYSRAHNDGYDMGWTNANHHCVSGDLTIDEAVSTLRDVLQWLETAKWSHGVGVIAQLRAAICKADSSG